MQSYGQFDVYPLQDNLPIWRDRDAAEAIAMASRKQKLHVVRREGDLYCIRLLGIGYGYVRAEDVVSEREAARQNAANRPRAAYAAGGGGGAGGYEPLNQYATGDQFSDSQTVGFLERLLAYVIDAVLILGALFVLMMILGIEFPHTETETVRTAQGEMRRARMVVDPRYTLLSTGIGIVYFIGFWSAFAATPGKMLLGQLIVDAKTGQPIGTGASIIRYIGSIISAIPFFLGYLWILWDGEKQGWHDKMASTKVIHTR
jgi:uncharacterized RDD family membrane protein YckC